MHDDPCCSSRVKAAGEGTIVIPGIAGSPYSCRIPFGLHRICMAAAKRGYRRGGTGTATCRARQCSSAGPCPDSPRRSDEHAGWAYRRQHVSELYPLPRAGKLRAGCLHAISVHGGRQAAPARQRTLAGDCRAGRHSNPHRYAQRTGTGLCTLYG
ncbi:hypothetical protein D3C80_1633540 [compost metagenome]